jgi:hypothetical protein
VRDAGRLDRPHLLQPDLGAPEVVEEASAAPEQHWNDVELELVQEPRRQVLLNNLGAAPEPDVLTVRGLLRPSPSGFSSLWFGPATNPSAEIEM